MSLPRQKLADEYQALLCDDEATIATVKRAVALVHHVLGGRIRASVSGLSYEAVGSGQPVHSKLLEKPGAFGNGFVQQQLRNVVGRAASDGVRERSLRSLVIDCSLSLAIVPEIAADRSWPLDEKRCSLLFDSCILLAHHAYFGLLPALDRAALKQERSLLLAALHRFADLAPAPADRYAVLALYFDALKQHRRAGEAYRQALAATQADSHEFMTTLQTYWTFLIERGLPEQALELLLDTYPRVPRRDLEELSDLIRETFKHRASPRRQKTGASRPKRT